MYRPMVGIIEGTIYLKCFLVLILQTHGNKLLFLKRDVGLMAMQILLSLWL